MNSVMGIGENIIFLNKGHLSWQGTKDDIFSSKDEAFNEFVFASDIMKEVKTYVNSCK